MTSDVVKVMSIADRQPIRVEIYCPQTPLPQLPTTLLSCSETATLPPYIVHLSSEGLQQSTQSNPNVIDLLHDYASIFRPYASELCQFGAVYLRTGPPHPRVSPRPRRVTYAEATEPLVSSTPIYIRVYAVPKRHQLLTQLLLLSRSSDAVVICKPAGLPVAPTVDNARECVLRIAEELLDEKELHITTRLDVCTSGVLILARKRQVVARLNSAIADARKTYLVWTKARPEAGFLKHWINAAASRRRGSLKQPLIAKWSDSGPPTRDEDAKWVHALLEITSVKLAGKVWQSYVVLLTGRTHQIRVQFASENWPLIGDLKYNAGGRLMHPADKDVVLGEDPQCLGLHAFSINVDLGSDDDGENHTEFVASVSMRGTHGIEGLEIDGD